MLENLCRFTTRRAEIELGSLVRGFRLSRALSSDCALLKAGRMIGWPDSQPIDGGGGEI